MPTATEKATAYLDGKPLVLSESVEWTLKEGVLPNIQRFAMAPDDAAAVTRGKPITLEITPVLGAPLKVQFLFALRVLPAKNPRIAYVEVADRRIWWPYAHVERHYNMRRAVGVKRLLDNTNSYEVNFDRAPQVAYWKWSVDPSKWIALTILGDVFTDVSRAERSLWGNTFTKITVDSRIGQNIKNLPIEEFSLIDEGHNAVERAIRQLPEAGVTVDYDGTPTVFSRAAGDEVDIVKALVPEIWNAGHVDLVDQSTIRPREIHFLFTRKVEVRFDLNEATLASTATAASGPSQTIVETPVADERKSTARSLYNVLPVVDTQTDGKSGRLSPITGPDGQSITLPQGAWITFDDFFKASPTLPIIGISRKLDHDLLQRAFIPGMDLWSALGLIGTFPDDQGNLAPWVPRIAACKAHYRQTFRLPSTWVDRFLWWDCVRLATIDPQSGQPGRSMAYGDYCILPSQRAKYRNLAQGVPMVYAMNKTAYPANADGSFSATTLPGPGVMHQLDMDQGILRVEYVMDNMQSYEQILPSQMVGESIPSADLTQRTRPIAFNAILGARKPPRLSAGFKMATIITAIPASPNNNQQLHRIVVKPADVRSLLPAAAQKGLDNAKGPIKEVRIGQGVEVARIPWDDTKVTLIEQIFGITPVAKDTASQVAFSDAVAALCLNQDKTNTTTGASLNAIAVAEAASIWGSFVDRYEGSATFHMNGNVHLSGWTGEITHEYQPDGATLTRISFPTTIPQMSLWAFLGKSERALALRLVEP